MARWTSVAIRVAEALLRYRCDVSGSCSQKPVIGNDGEKCVVALRISGELQDIVGEDIGGRKKSGSAGRRGGGRKEDAGGERKR